MRLVLKLERIFITIAVMILACTIVSLTMHFVLISTSELDWLRDAKQAEPLPEK